MVQCPVCGNETYFPTEIQLELNSCPYCGFSGFLKSDPEPQIIVRPPEVQRVVTPNFVVILRTLKAVHWDGGKDELVKASQALGEKRYSDACNNLRMALVTIWVKVAERLSPQPVAINQTGKTIDLTPLVKVLRDKGVPEDAIGLISRTWSFLSERTHIEKKNSVQPRPSEAYYGLQLTLAAIEFLLRFTQAHKMKPGTG
jgi:hypothetical protein